MIVETSKLNNTQFTLMPGKKPEANEVSKLILRIKEKQKEPFAKIYLTLHPIYFMTVSYALNQAGIKIKGMSPHNKLFVMEI